MDKSDLHQEQRYLILVCKIGLPTRRIECKGTEVAIQTARFYRSMKCAVTVMKEIS